MHVCGKDVDDDRVSSHSKPLLPVLKMLMAGQKPPLTRAAQGPRAARLSTMQNYRIAVSTRAGSCTWPPFHSACQRGAITVGRQGKFACRSAGRRLPSLWRGIVRPKKKRAGQSPGQTVVSSPRAADCRNGPGRICRLRNENFCEGDGGTTRKW